ncbi:YdgA family protein [Variovorax boronicumulans]|uniref:YdgA family protein n=1 Tax=Variovorax boronicumulans TaxID=436515 RepID=UPI00339700EE
MSKKAVLGVLAAAIAVAYGGSTWWAGTKVKSSYDNAFAELPKQTALVRVIERQYERGFMGATSTVTLEIGCAAEAAAAPAAAQTPAAKPAEGEEEAQAADEEEEEAESTPPKPVRITFRDTIRHGPIAGGSFAAATIDSELVLDIKAQAQAEKLFGKAKPVTAHTKVGFDGAYASDIVVAPARFAEEGKGELAWQGAKARVEVNAARTQVRYDMTMPGMDVNDPAKGLQLKMGSFTAKADMDSSAGWILATGKTEGRLEALEFSATKGLGATDADAPAGAQKPVKLLLQNIDLIGQASLKDGLYASDGTLKGKGKIGETAIDSFEMTSGARRIHAAGYKKLADAWLQSSAAGGCGKSSKASKAAMQALADQLAPDLKAMAKYSPEFGLDKMAVEIGGKRGELGYTASMAGVTDEDLQEPGMALLMKRGVLKAHARLPMQWLETIAAIGAESGQTPPPEMLAGLVEQGEEKGFVKREGDDVTAQLEFSEGNLKVNGKPLNAMGQ